jgi:hypothetical protein
MAIVAKAPQSNFPVAPEGLFQAVAVDVHEPWTEERPQQYGGGIVDKVRICWLIDELDEYGKPYEVSQIYTFTLHPKGKLAQHLEAWRGKPMTDEDRAGFDLEKLIGANCQVQIQHSEAKNGTGRTYANVVSIVPLGKGQVKIPVPANYVRKKDRPSRDAKPQASGRFEASMSDVPFALLMALPLLGLVG